MPEQETRFAEKDVWDFVKQNLHLKKPLDQLPPGEIAEELTYWAEE
jgi:hypothetical protein